MQFLKALFWFLILGLAAAFAVTNWHPVEIHLWVLTVPAPTLQALTVLGVRWELAMRATCGMLQASSNRLTQSIC